MLRTIRLACRSWPFFTLLLCGGLFGLAATAFCGERAFRLLGLVMQVAGFVTVAFGLNEARKLFGKPTLRQRTKTYLIEAASLFRTPPPIRASINVVEENDTLSGAASVSAKQDATIDEQITLINQKLDNLFNGLTMLDAKLNGVAGVLKSDLSEEGVARQQGDENISQKLSEAVAGGLHIEALGLFLFVGGILLSTASSEIATLFGSATSCPISPTRWLAFWL